jgi:hypothetical protein
MFQKYKTQVLSVFGSRLKRSGYLCMSIVLVLSVSFILWPARADAYNQVTSRSILMSSTANAATNVAYQVNFTTVTNNQTVGSVVVRICSNSPIIGDTCTSPPDFDFNKSTLTVNNITGNITGLSVDVTNSTANRIVLTRTSGTVANGAVSFTLGNGTTNGITNPSTTNVTFYARILILSSTDGTITGSDENNATDAGGIALSTAAQLKVTAKVQEALTFCVYTLETCQDGGVDVSLGDENGVLASNSTTYVGNASFDIASNAVAGVVVRLKGDVLKSGPFSIDAAGSSCLVDPTSTGTEMFGLRISTLGSGTSADAPYDCASGRHGFDTSNSTGTTSAFGDAIAHTSGATDTTTSTLEFAAKSANTSEAGVYTTDLTLIATATY